jgi:hypothetical protein
MKMKILAFSCIIFALLGCDKFDKFTQFNMEFNETVVIPSSTGINLPINLRSPDVDTNSESVFAVNDTRKNLVEEILIKKLKLTLTSPSNADFSFLKSISVFISAEGLEEIKIAWKEDIQNNVGKELELELTGADLKEFILKDKFSLRLNTVTDEILTSDHSIDIQSIFFVDAKILGQ